MINKDFLDSRFHGNDRNVRLETVPIEPIIGHAKSDGHLGRNYLKGRNDDRFNVFLSAIGFNLRQILRKLRIFWLHFSLGLFGKFQPLAI